MIFNTVVKSSANPATMFICPSFDGNIASNIAIAWLVLPMPDVVPHPGVCPVGLLKYLRGHCFAIHVTSHKEVIILETGIMPIISATYCFALSASYPQSRSFKIQERSSYARIQCSTLENL
ncbi:hypothetical protein Plhal703r1_c14g0070351 [Plasmopara halstedii]